MKTIQVLVVKDEDGIMRPMAGIWIENDAGIINAKIYARKNPEDAVVSATLTETI